MKFLGLYVSVRVFVQGFLLGEGRGSCGPGVRNSKTLKRMTWIPGYYLVAVICGNMRGWSTSNNLEQQTIAGANRQRYYEVRR